MRVLVACEESQAVTIELRKLGHEAYSCDIKPCTGGHPEWHIEGDAIKEAYSGEYDMMIAFPPCTHLCVSGSRHFEKKRADGRQQEGIDFFMKMATAPIEKIAIENPVGIMSTVWRPPDDIINPWEFGDEFSKKTCLWLKNLDKLMATKIVEKGDQMTFPSGRRMSQWMRDSWKLEQDETSTARSKTFPGIAKAMAATWTKPQRQISMF